MQLSPMSQSTHYRPGTRRDCHGTCARLHRVFIIPHLEPLHSTENQRINYLLHISLQGGGVHRRFQVKGMRRAAR